MVEIIDELNCNHCGRSQGQVISSSGSVMCIYCHKWIDESKT